jgi:hypothetical protein
MNFHIYIHEENKATKNTSDLRSDDVITFQIHFTFKITVKSTALAQVQRAHSFFSLRREGEKYLDRG